MTEQKEEQKKFELVEVPTKMGLAVKDNESEEVMDTLKLLIKIANDLDEIKKGLIGK